LSGMFNSVFHSLVSTALIFKFFSTLFWFHIFSFNYVPPDWVSEWVRIDKCDILVNKFFKNSFISRIYKYVL
jgi:hypothetical protein